MIVGLIALWSLCAIYFTHLLNKKGMKIASSLVAVLYGYVLVWVYLLFFIDVGDVGFNLTKMHESSPYCGAIYRAFNSISVGMNGFSDQFLTAIIIISAVIAVSAFTVIISGSIRIAREVRRIVKELEHKFNFANVKRRVTLSLAEYKDVPLIKRYCRANC